MEETSERHGVLNVGDVPLVIRRDAFVEIDHSQAVRSAKEAAYREMLVYVKKRYEETPAYEDTRPWIEMRLLLSDKIKEALADG